MVGTLGVVVLVVAWAWLRKPARSSDPVQRAWLKLQRRLQRRGLGPAIGETPLHWAERIAPRLADGDRLLELAELYCLLRYGDRDESDLAREFIGACRRVSHRRFAEPQALTSV